MSASSSPNAGSLRGLKVIDLSRVYAGPACTQMLADHGADVIKIEPPQGDETRDWGPRGPDGLSAYYWGLNRNKRTLALDLEQPAARELLLQLLADADVLVDNFKLGTLERWGLGYEQSLKAQFSGLIHLTISGFGTDGPLAGYPGYDAAAQAFAGIMSVNGEHNGEPLKLPMPVVDYATGLHACSAILMALFEKQRSGYGQHIDLSLFDVALTVTHPLSTTWMFTGDIPAPAGNVYAAIAPYGVYNCQDRKVFTGAGNDPAFQKLCQVLNLNDLVQDPRFADNRSRVANRDVLDNKINDSTASWEGEELSLALMRGGVAAAVVMNLKDAFDHPQTIANEMIAELGAGRVVANPIKMRRTPARMTMPAPNFAQDTDAILLKLGYDPNQIAYLEKSGVLIRHRRKTSKT